VLPLLGSQAWSQVVLRVSWFIDVLWRAGLPLPPHQWVESKRRDTNGQNSYAASTVERAQLVPSQFAMILNHVRQYQGLAAEAGEEAAAYRMRLHGCVHALESIVQDSQALEVFERTRRKTGTLLSQERAAKRCLFMVLAVRFSRSRQSGRIMDQFKLVSEAVLPPSISKLAQKLTFPQPSAATLCRRQLSLDAALCSMHREHLASCGECAIALAEEII